MTTKQRAFLETCTDEEVDDACNWIYASRQIEKELNEIVNSLKNVTKQPFKILDETYFKEDK